MASAVSARADLVSLFKLGAALCMLSKWSFSVGGFITEAWKRERSGGSKEKPGSEDHTVKVKMICV